MAESLNMSIRLQKQKGFSLIELMIAMVIGLVLMSGIVSVFASSRKSFDMTQEISSVQESARFAMDALNEDIRLAGFQGCAMSSGISGNSAEIQALNAPTSDYYFTATRGAEISGTTWSPAAPAELANLDPAPVSDSDVLMLQYASPVTSQLAAAMTSPSDEIELINNATGLESGDLAIISNCAAADLFRVSGVSGDISGGASIKILHAPGANSSDSLSAQYDPATDMTRVMKFNYITYYVGDTGRLNSAGDPIYSLYAYDIDALHDNQDPTEIIEGVENMQVLFGIRANNNTVRYINADHADFDASLVQSIQVGLLMYSIENASDQDDENTYRVLNTDIGPAGSSTGGPTHAKDRRIRMTFNSTVKVRNRRANP